MWRCWCTIGRADKLACSTSSSRSPLLEHQSRHRRQSRCSSNNNNNNRNNNLFYSSSVTRSKRCNIISLASRPAVTTRTSPSSKFRSKRRHNTHRSTCRNLLASTTKRTLTGVTCRRLLDGRHRRSTTCRTMTGGACDEEETRLRSAVICINKPKSVGK